MNLVEQSATKVAQYIHDNVENSSSVAVLRFSLIVMFNFIITLLMVLAVCVITGRFKDGLIAVIALPLLRYFSGGVHLKSSHLCNFISAGLMLLAIHITFAESIFLYSLTAVSCIIILLYAPQGIDGTSRLKPQHYPILKAISFIIIASNFIWMSPLLANIFFLQALTTLPVTQKITNKLNL